MKGKIHLTYNHVSVNLTQSEVIYLHEKTGTEDTWATGDNEVHKVDVRGLLSWLPDGDLASKFKKALEAK